MMNAETKAYMERLGAHVSPLPSDRDTAFIEAADQYGYDTSTELDGSFTSDETQRAWWVWEAANSAQAEQLAHALKAVEYMNDLIMESKGVAGYHLNGNIAAWGEFEIEALIEQAMKQGGTHGR